MTGRSTRDFTRLAAAIIVAAVVIGAAAILASSYPGTATTTGSSENSVSLSSTSIFSTTFNFEHLGAQYSFVQFHVGIEPQPQNATTEIIPANTLAWTSWTVTNSTRLDGFENQFPIGPQNYNSSIVAAIY